MSKTAGEMIKIIKTLAYIVSHMNAESLDFSRKKKFFSVNRYYSQKN